MRLFANSMDAKYDHSLELDSVLLHVHLRRIASNSNRTNVTSFQSAALQTMGAPLLLFSLDFFSYSYKNPTVYFKRIEHWTFLMMQITNNNYNKTKLHTHHFPARTQNSVDQTIDKCHAGVKMFNNSVTQDF